MVMLLFSISQKIGDAKFEVQRKHHKCSSYQRHIPENKLNQIKIVLLLFRNIEKILVKKKQTNKCLQIVHFSSPHTTKSPSDLKVYIEQE